MTTLLSFRVLSYGLVFFTLSPLIAGAAPTKNNTHQGWFAFTPNNEIHQKKTTSAIGMEQWLLSPQFTANQPHRLLTKENTIIRNGITQKIWGTNVNYINNAPSRSDAIKRTHFFAKYGINSVRLHKLSNASWEGLGGTHKASEYDPVKLDRFDFWLNTLKNNGISYGLSPIWDLRIFDGDKKALLAYDEIVNASPKKPVTTGLVWFAPDIQKIHIDTLTNLLNHKNPYTNLRYAEDPSIAYIEIQNEENIFFYSFFSRVKRHPSYHQLLAEQFSLWLQKKYKTHANLITYWGGSAIDAFTNEGTFSGEALHKKNITPFMNPWVFDQMGTSGKYAKRLQDTVEFLFKKQQEYYRKAQNAIRATGFEGIIVNSNWQAGSKGAHFLNLLSDTYGGIVDRHNYQGGAKGEPQHLVQSGFTLNNHTMLNQPGSSMLSSGMQQVANMPFMLSEWLAVVPSEYAAADTTIMAAYGFGLQGWDASYHFASDSNHFTPTLSQQGNKFSNLHPVGVGLYPILSRMVLRGDIAEGNIIATRRLSKQQAINHSYDFSHTTQQEHDLKSFSGTPHHHALAAGQVVIEFTEKESSSSFKNWREIHEQKNIDGSSTITSSTNELAWTYDKSKAKNTGFVTINSQGTQGVLGFLGHKKIELNDINITPQSPYSVILATAKSQNQTIQSDRNILLLAIARAHNTNMVIENDVIKNLGVAPIILEPVKATIDFKRRATVTVLDHDGIKTSKIYSLDNGIFELDTERDKAIYYLVSFLD